MEVIQVSNGGEGEGLSEGVADGVPDPAIRREYFSV